MVLLLATFAWGSSFPAIKIVVDMVGENVYVGVRSILALMGLTPYVIWYHYRNGFERKLIAGALITGVVYALGLWLQGWGIRFTTASTAAFITGLYVVFVYIHDSIGRRVYGLRMFLSLLFAVSGLYLLTVPESGFGFGFGEFLVLIGAVFWAMQILLVDRFSRMNPLVFTFYEILPSLLFLLGGGVGLTMIPLPAFFLLMYLGLICTDFAFVGQVYGQRWLPPFIASLIMILEIVFATILSVIFLGEELTPLKLIGGTVILAGIYLSLHSYLH